jgi:peptide/nickel transport system substrate-binding protein
MPTDTEPRDELDARVTVSLSERPLTRREVLRRAAVGGALLVGGGLVPAAQARLAAGPKRGGTFRLGCSGGGAKDMIDAQTTVQLVDTARLVAGFEPLIAYSDSAQLENVLAESIEATRPDVWTIRVRSGIEFHNGKTMTADDVIYSLQRIVNPKLGLFGGGGLIPSINPHRIKKLDKYTVRLFLKRRDSTLPQQLANYTNNIVPVGYDKWPHPQVGTGPFVLDSFSPGRQSVHHRNPNYWRTGQPYFDKVIVLDFPDDSARVNALISNQVDAIISVPGAQAARIKSTSQLALLESVAGSYNPFVMRIDQDPFTDVRVRQAFRLIIDRPQMVEQALNGFGRVGNDLFAIFDPDYNHSLPQRHQDLEKAKGLLKAAGKENLTIDLQTTPAATGMLEMAQVFAQQAKGAGVTVNVKNLDQSVFFGSNWLKWTFATDYWGTRPYLAQVAIVELPTAANNETHWPPKRSSFTARYTQALATLDDAKRRSIVHEMQAEEHESGGYIIPYFNNLLDAYNTRVKGLKPSKNVAPLNGFAHGYRTAWFG